MARLRRRLISQPDERREIARGWFGLFELAGHEVSWQHLEPGWRWSESVKPIAGTEYCEFHHVGYTLSGSAHVQMRDGAELDIGAEQFFEVPPYHDAWVVGDEPWIAIDWGENVAFARAQGLALQRVVATLLFTDIVESTATARRLGDARWRDLLSRHNRIVRTQFELYRGREASTTGDGFLALFDSAEAAVRAALATATAVESAGVRVRCAVHTGEVEVEAGNVRGLSVHVAARVLALAQPGEVLVSWTTREMLAGSRLDFDDRGEHELKGIPEPKRVYAVRDARPMVRGGLG